MQTLPSPNPSIDKILDQSTAEPPELPRLTVAVTFNTYQRLHDAIESAQHYCGQVPTATPGDCTQHLKDIIKQCEGAIKHAARLLEANR
jgi:hypothetical protein